jgi:SHS2 domain-containing protein
MMIRSLHLQSVFTKGGACSTMHKHTLAAVASPLAPSHEIVDHASEIRLRVCAGSLRDVLEEAGRAVCQLQLRGADATRGSWRTIQISAPDRATLLVAWLNELIFLAEAERWVGADFEVDSAEDGKVSARVWGVRIQRASAPLKAATPHGLRVNEVPGGLQVEVTLGA